jgi:DNA-binding LacI/PurR family transcriptional regulator
LQELQAYVTVEEINTVAFKKEEEINTVETPLNKLQQGVSEIAQEAARLIHAEIVKKSLHFLSESLKIDLNR